MKSIWKLTGKKLQLDVVLFDVVNVRFRGNGESILGVSNG